MNYKELQIQTLVEKLERLTNKKVILQELSIQEKLLVAIQKLPKFIHYFEQVLKANAIKAADGTIEYIMEETGLSIIEAKKFFKHRVVEGFHLTKK